jgi:hypothetical protein
VHKRVRKHSALLLLMAPIVAIGSSFLVAGSASATTKSVKPTITVCKSVAGTFRFTVNGKALVLHSQCAAVTAKAGVNHVIEISAPASYRNLASISVSPNAARVSSSLRTATATVKLAAHGAATVRFVNAKVVTQVITRSAGSAPRQATGSIEICKFGSDLWVPGNGTSWPFTYTGGSASVPFNECTSQLTVDAGTVTITEGDVYPYVVSNVDTFPPYALASATAGYYNSIGGSSGGATVTVSAGQDVEVNFWNATLPSYFKLCKVLANNQGSLAGSTFDYGYTWSFTPPAAILGAMPITGSGTTAVTAVASSGSVCTAGIAVPAGATITAWETGNVPYVDVTNVAIQPAGDNMGSAGGTAIFTAPTDGSVSSATFTNEPLGYVEVCKDFYPSGYDAGNSAQFSVNGGPSFWVAGGACSAPIEVPAGTATVSETIGAGFFLWNVSTFSATDVFGTRLLSGDTVNPASVVVPYGGVGNETVVTFTNTVEPTQFKICKQETSADANLSGGTFSFGYSYSIGATAYSGSVSLTIAPVTPSNPTGLVCSGLIWGPPVLDTSGDPIPVAIWENATTLPGVQLDSIGYQGNGSLIYDSTDGGLDPVQVSQGDIGASCIDPGAGINVVTFTNGSVGASSVVG